MKEYSKLSAKERMEKFIITLGFVPIPSLNKHKIFHKTWAGQDRYIFISSKGLIKVGKTKVFSEAEDMTDGYILALSEYEVKNNLFGLVL